MKNLSRYLTSLMLIAMAYANAQAQEAFYIYQNDGHFNGFFYDEVQKISYSKLDTLGFEHEDFVSQEIITADSTYRIMLTAIDSVGFQQPAVEFHSNVRNVREEGMIDYISYRDDVKMDIYFYNSTPADKIPHIGDVLVDFDLEEGFSGKVTNIDDSGIITIVHLEPLESIRDVFRQFVCVEQIDKDSEGNLIRRRVAGAPHLTEGDWSETTNASRKASDTFEGNIMNFGFSGHLPLYASENFNATLDANLAVALTIKGSYNIPVIGAYYIGLTFQQDVTMGLGVTLDGKLSEMKKREVKFGASVPIPAAAPIFELRSIPGLFLRGEAHVKFSADLIKKAQRVWYKLEFHNDWLPTFNFGSEQLPELDEAISEPDARDASIEFNGFIQAGLYAPLELGVNRWLSSIMNASFGTTVYLGPKLSGALNLSISDVYKDQFSFYNLIKGSNLSLTPLSLDYETKAKLKTLFSDEQEVTIADGSTELISPISLYLVPEFGVDATVRDNPYSSTVGAVETKITPSRNIIWPVEVGAVLYNSKGKEVNKQYSTNLPNEYRNQLPFYSQYNKEWEKEKHFKTLLTPMSPGNYTVRPIMKLLGVEFPASPAVKVKVPGTFIEILADTITTTCQGGWINIPFRGQYDSIEISGGNYVKEYELSSGTDDEHTLRINVLPNYCYANIEWEIFIRVLGKDGAGRDDKVVIRQTPNDIYLPTEVSIKIRNPNSDYVPLFFEFFETDFTVTFEENGLHVEKANGSESKASELNEENKTYNFAFDVVFPPDNPEWRKYYTVRNGSFSETYSRKFKHMELEAGWKTVDWTFSGTFDNLTVKQDVDYAYGQLQIGCISGYSYSYNEHSSTSNYSINYNCSPTVNPTTSWSGSGECEEISITLCFPE